MQVGCKTSLVLFNYFIMANFFWLLVEGLYLHMLLLVIYNYSIHFSIYMLIGWGRLRLLAAAPTADRSYTSFLPPFCSI